MNQSSESSEQAAFRAHCKAWLASGLPPRPGFRLPLGPLEIATREQLEYLCAWQKAAHAAGLVGCDYPRTTAAVARAIASASPTRSKAAGVPFFPNIVGLGMAAPTILHHGTEEQKRRFLPGCSRPTTSGVRASASRARAATSRTCKGWPKRRRRLGRQRPQGVDDAGALRQWMILLARTTARTSTTVSPTSSRRSRGHRPRGDRPPAGQDDGRARLQRGALRGHPIADDLRLDEVGRGWTVAMTTLLHERGAAVVTPRRAAGSVTTARRRSARRG